MLRRMYTVIFLLVLAIPAFSQTYELACPSGYSPLPFGQTFNPTTGKYRAFLCVDPNGTVNLPGISSLTFPIDVSTGQAITESGTGQVTTNQLQILPGLPAPSISASLTGGSLVSGRSISVVYTLVSALGETRQSVSTNGSMVSFGCSSGTTCSVTVTAPAIPTGYTGYTVYSQDCGSVPCSGSEKKQLISNACVNITGNCVIQVAGAGASPPTTNTAFSQPSPLSSSNFCPQGAYIWGFTKMTDGNWLPMAANDSSLGNPTPSPDGTVTICGRLFFNDSGQNLQSATQQGGGPIRNSLVSIAHKSGTTTAHDSSTDDRGVSVRTVDDPNSGAYHQWLGYYGEHFIYNTNFTCNPIGNTGQGEDCAAAIRARTNVQVNTVAAIQGFVGIHGTASTNVTPMNVASCSPCVIGVAGTASQESVGNQVTNATYAGVTGFANASTGNSGSAFGVSFWAIPPVTRFTTQNIGLYILPGFNNSSDFAIRSDATSPSKFQGTFKLGAASTFTANATQSMGVTGALTGAASLSIAPFSVPVNVSVNNIGAAGATSYSYKVCILDGNNGTVCQASNSTTATGNATLNGTNFNRIGIVLANTSIPGAARVDVYRTASAGTPATTGKIGSATITDIAAASATFNFDDTGLAGDSTTPPTTNSTGSLSVGGPVKTGTASNTDFAGQLTLSAGTVSRTFDGIYTSAPICVATDTTAINAVRVQTTTTTLTLTGTTTDVLNYICAGRN